MIKFAISTLVLVTGLAAGLAAPAAAQEQAGGFSRGAVEIHGQTCKHYANRARFKARTEEAALEVILADSCARAYKSLYNRFDTAPHEIKHARGYLDRLADFKAMIIQMNMDRMFGKARTRRTQLQVPTVSFRSKDRGIQPISPFGEYLIAREMGVLGAYLAWADVTDFKIAEER